MAQKYQIEKIIHEMIRDIPEASKVNRNYEYGMYTLDSFLMELARIYREEKKEAS